MNYAHTVTVTLSYEQAVQQTRELLAEQGFGVLSEIDVRATFEAKLGVESAQALGDYINNSGVTRSPGVVVTRGRRQVRRLARSASRRRAD